MSKKVEHIANLIQSEIGFFNGWGVAERAERAACKDAAVKIEKYIKGRIRRELRNHGLLRDTPEPPNNN